ncbi:MAG: DUF4382 domain-containing protein [Petrimonas sp.]|jgi:hypothetical protein
MSLKLLRSTSFFLVFVLVFTTCSKNDPSINATRLRISLTDAPTLLIRELNVDIQKIEVSTVESENDNETWTTLKFNGGVFNILTLSNGKSKQIVDQYFPSGVLRQIKITFGTKSNIVAVTKDDVIDLILDPSIQDGVVILDVTANLYANYISNIMIDINAAMSVYELNGNYFFRPTIRAFPETFGGTLKGVVSPKEADAAVLITKVSETERDTLFTVPESTNGMFMFKGVSEGNWKVHIITMPELGYKDTVFITDSVYTGKILDLKSITLKKIEDIENE